MPVEDGIPGFGIVGRADSQYLEDPAIRTADAIADGTDHGSRVWWQAVSRQAANLLRRNGTEPGYAKQLPIVAVREPWSSGIADGRWSFHTASTGGMGSHGHAGGHADQNRDGSMVDDVIGILGRSFAR